VQRADGRPGGTPPRVHPEQRAKRRQPRRLIEKKAPRAAPFDTVSTAGSALRAARRRRLRQREAVADADLAHGRPVVAARLRHRRVVARPVWASGDSPLSFGGMFTNTANLSLTGRF